VRRATKIAAALSGGLAPYEQLDLATARRLASALFAIGALYVAVLAPFAPPRGGPLAWAALGATLLIAAACAVLLVRTSPEAVGPRRLLALAYLSVVLVGVLSRLSGPAAPWTEVLLLICIYNGAVHPPRRVAELFAAVGAVAFAPVLWASVDGSWVAVTGAKLVLWWGAGLVAMAWSVRVRSLRRELGDARDGADRLARVDALTGLGNRRALEEGVARAAATARRTDRPLAVIFADVDGFKGVNDGWGHHAGDAALRDVAEVFAASVRVPDPCFRWGGDELVALLPGTSLGEAEEIAARVRDRVHARCRRPDGAALGLTVGCAALRDGETGDEMVARADMVMMAAKAERAGR